MDYAVMNKNNKLCQSSIDTAIFNFHLIEFQRTIKASKCTHLNSIYRPIMLRKWADNLLWWRFSLSIAGQHWTLLCSHHELGWHGRFKFQWNSSLWAWIFLYIWTQQEGFCWLTHLTNIPPQNLSISAGGEAFSTCGDISDILEV